MTEPTRYLFVYGTLREDPSHDMYRVLARSSQFVGDGEVQARLYDLGDYPGIVPSKSPQDKVRGEVYELRPEKATEVLRVLDVYEGLAADDPLPREYRREVVRVILDSNSLVDAWAYVLDQLLPAYKPIPSSDYLEWRKSNGQRNQSRA